MITCCRCNGKVPDGWEKLTRADRDGLKAAMGIVPVCAKCLSQARQEKYWRNSLDKTRQV